MFDSPFANWVGWWLLWLWHAFLWLACAAAVIAALAFLVWLVWKAPVRAASEIGLSDAKDRAETQDMFRKTIVQTIGGLAFFATFAFTVYQFAAQQEQASRQHANTEFVDAIKLFNDNNATSNAGALYTLQKVAEQRSEFVSPVVDTIAFFVRRQPEPKSKDVSETVDGRPTVRSQKTPSPTDVQAAIAILASLNKDGVRPPDLRNAAIHNARFSETDDCGSEFPSAAKARSAKGFQRANFQAALIFGSRFCSINLSNAAFDGAWANFEYAYGRYQTKEEWDKRSSTDIRHLFIVSFFNSDLINAGFENAHFAGADFSRSRLAGARFENTDLTLANFGDAALGDAAWFSAAKGKAHFHRAVLVDADFSRVDLDGVNFEAANITGTDFSSAINAEKANFKEACEDRPAKFKNEDVRRAVIKAAKRCTP